jgi:hypothetical protein
MKILRKKQDGPTQTRIEKRVASLPTSDLVEWTETSMFTIGKYLNEWTKSKDPVALEEVLLGAEAFYAIAKELKKRNEPRSI